MEFKNKPIIRILRVHTSHFVKKKSYNISYHDLQLGLISKKCAKTVCTVLKAKVIHDGSPLSFKNYAYSRFQKYKVKLHNQNEICRRKIFPKRE